MDSEDGKKNTYINLFQSRKTSLHTGKKKRHFNHFDNVKLIRGKYSLGSINQLIRAKPPVEEEGTATLNTEEEEPVGSE